MAEATAGATPLLPGLPDEIVVWEILVRLPHRSLLRCRAVCPAWRRVTSTHDFLLAHHDRQPNLPLLHGYVGASLDIVFLDHRARVAAADQLQSIARLGSRDSYRAYRCMEASCDGLVILSSVVGDPSFHDERYFSVCNPATRQYAVLPLFGRFCLAGMYPHSTTGEYRLLLYLDTCVMPHELPSGAQDGFFVYALGSCQPPRHIGWPEAEALIRVIVPVLFRGSLHWFVRKDESKSSMIMVFNNAAELFRQMCTPAIPGAADLFDIDGMLGMASFNDTSTTIDIWVLQDYESEVWSFKCRIELPLDEIRVHCDMYDGLWNAVVVPRDDEVLVLVRFENWLLQVDMDSKLVASFNREHTYFARLRLKQTLISHTFFATLEGYVVNDSPFIPKIVERSS